MEIEFPSIANNAGEDARILGNNVGNQIFRMKGGRNWPVWIKSIEGGNNLNGPVNIQPNTKNKIAMSYRKGDKKYLASNGQSKQSTFAGGSNIRDVPLKGSNLNARIYDIRYYDTYMRPKQLRTLTA
jgi:hypothetical protein